MISVMHGVHCIQSNMGMEIKAHGMIGVKSESGLTIKLFFIGF